MNKALIAIFLILNMTFSSAVFLKSTQAGNKFQTFNQLRNIQESEFGKRILDTINLQLTNKSPLGDVAKMLADIRQNLALQQQEANSLHVSQEQDCSDTIDNLESTIITCQANADDATTNIGVLKSEISALGTKILQMGNQLDILANRKILLAQSRQTDREDYARRQAEGPGVLEAIDLIISHLATIQPTDEDAAFAELAKTGKTNPIYSLVQVASTFSQQTLTNVISKMAYLKESLAAALEGDVQNEIQAEAQYNQIMGEIDTTSHNVQQALTEAENQKRQKEASLALQEKRLTENTECVTTSQEKKVAKTEQCAGWRAKYETDKVNRAEEIEVIKQVEEIVATRLDTMKDYLKDSANQE